MQQRTETDKRKRRNLDINNTHLSIATGLDCIDRAHCLGCPEASDINDGTRPQPIIVKFEHAMTFSRQSGY